MCIGKCVFSAERGYYATKKGVSVGKYRCEEIPCIVISVASTPFICLSVFHI